MNGGVAEEGTVISPPVMSAPPYGRLWLLSLGIGSAVPSVLPFVALGAAGLCMKGGCAKQGGADWSAEAGVTSSCAVLGW